MTAPADWWPRLIATHDTLVVNDHRMVVVTDPACPPFAAHDPAFSRAQEDVAAGDGYRLWLCCWTDLGDVLVSLRVWTARPLPDGGWDGSALFTHDFPTGRVQVATMTGGPDAEWELPEAGTYDVRVRWRNRELFRERVHELLGRFSSPGGAFDSAGFAAAEAAMTGREEYRLDLWRRDVPDPESPLRPLPWSPRPPDDAGDHHHDHGGDGDADDGGDGGEA